MKVLFPMLFVLLSTSGLLAQHEAGSLQAYPHFEDLQPLLTKNNDTTYVINFWATWCKPCVREMPYFQQLHEAYAEQPVKVILVSLDMQRDLKVRVPDFIESHGLTPLIVVLTDTDSNAWIPKVHPDWSGAIPATWIRKGDTVTFVEEEIEELQTLVDMVEKVKNHN